MSNYIRNSVALTDCNGIPYADIVSAHIELRYITSKQALTDQTIVESGDRGKSYVLMIDKTLFDELIEAHPTAIKCFVSFQRRIYGNIAVARRWDGKIEEAGKNNGTILYTKEGTIA